MTRDVAFTAGWRGAALAAVLLLLPSGPADAAQRPEADVFDPEAAIARSQAAIGRPIGDHGFTDRQGRTVRLAEFQGKPLVVNLVFTACTQSCPVLIEHLADAVAAAADVVGWDGFNVVTVGFDPAADRPERLAAYAGSHGITAPNWRFLAGDPAAIDALIDELGFLRYASPRGFDHLAQTSVIGPDGRVFHQVYGDDFEVQALVEPLKALVLRDVGGLASVSDVIERVRLFCTFYDASAGRYAFDYSFFIALTVGAASLLALGVILLRAWLSAGGPPEIRA